MKSAVGAAAGAAVGQAQLRLNALALLELTRKQRVVVLIEKVPSEKRNAARLL
jgi:hypothetical protein